MSVLTVRDAIVADLRAALPELVSCGTYPGRFDAAELARFSTRVPTALVACLGLDAIDERGEVGALASLAVFVVAGQRDTVALAVVEAVAARVIGNRWGSDLVETLPADVRAENLYSAAMDTRGVALWSVNWRQRVTLDPRVPAGLDDFLTFDARYERPGEDGEPIAEDLVSMPQGVV